jgi:hypothetical protein
MRGFRIAAAAAFASLVTLAAAPAHADTKSWTAAKAIAPESTAVVVSVDVTAIQKSTIYQSMVPALIAQEDDAKEGLDTIKASCGIDALTVITDVTVVMNDPDGDDQGLIVVGLNGINEAKTVACLKKIAKKEKKVLTAKKAGKITELSIKGERDKMYMAWLGKDVVAFATEPDQKALLTKMMAGKGVSAALSAPLGKVNTSAAGWMAFAKSMPIGPAGTMKTAYGSVNLTGGNIAVDVNVVMSSAAEAKKVVDEARKELAKGSAQLPPELQKVIKAIALTAAGDTVTVKLSLPESEAMSLLGLVMAM